MINGIKRNALTKYQKNTGVIYRLYTVFISERFLHQKKW